MKPATATKPRVLVVDDETSVLFTYKMILQQQGYDVTAVGSCREALEKVQQEDFDLLLCDYSLEQQHTGFEVIEAGRKKNPQVPAVILTGYASTETAQQAKDNGINVLFKPIEISEFLSATSALLKPGTTQ
jgi:CheY-like chemotaxis protein